MVVLRPIIKQVFEYRKRRMIRKQLEIAKRRLGISEREAWRCNTLDAHYAEHFIKATTDSWEPLHLGIYFRLCIFITDTIYLTWRAPLLIVHHFPQPQALRYEYTRRACKHL